MASHAGSHSHYKGGLSMHSNNKKVEFQDKGFERVVRSSLNIPESKKLTVADLNKITGIEIYKVLLKTISIPWSSTGSAFNMILPNLRFGPEDSENGLWVEDLKCFTQVRSMYLYLPMADLSFLSGYAALEQLTVLESRNKDWSFLKGLTKLQYLFLKDCNFTDLSVIRDLCVEQQDLLGQERKRRKENGGKLFFFPYLHNLALIRCGISDISPLADCKLISDLIIAQNKVTDISALASMRALYYLTMVDNQITDVSPLKALTGTYYINLKDNRISDVSTFAFLGSQGYLKRLLLGGNPIEDFSSFNNIRFTEADFPHYDPRDR